ncbi:hypothetical protein Deipe_4346 (plasmid) [Deinococcus peraridilitoris DSM 19664]|uniref:Uncharacterized protein n=1 Tax=Deinococcus peraridilitoris (strain DSM 19664 / LMG 22246 / CIP 109416 / KR-200) TaxID=937777 RepID=L0A799_DEIPD|nr:hypothetical protein Deipe_4346 [Deinococcus peraridilitoris DSM 19664]
MQTALSGGPPAREQKSTGHASFSQTKQPYEPQPGAGVIWKVTKTN